jgi:hypothetical protein
MPEAKFEASFRMFVKEFGGEVLIENSKHKLADYLFRKQNVVAELKCLTQDQTVAMNDRVAELIRQWVRKHNKPPRPEFLSIATAPPEIKIPWLNFLRSDIENIVRKANRQIRSTKNACHLPTAKGLLLVFNERNPLHNRPKDFRTLLESVLLKRKPDKQRAFPHINGVIYFSFETVKTETDGRSMNFWDAVRLAVGSEDTAPLKQFQDELQQAWYAYIQKTTGRTVRQFKGD